ncbi:hypothetical protein SRHO_G00312300 [Serrasalmus rhombeus]
MTGQTLTGAFPAPQNCWPGAKGMKEVVELGNVSRSVIGDVEKDIRGEPIEPIFSPNNIMELMFSRSRHEFAPVFITGYMVDRVTTFLP